MLDEATNDITQNIKILHPSQNDKKGDQLLLKRNPKLAALLSVIPGLGTVL